MRSLTVFGFVFLTSVVCTTSAFAGDTCGDGYLDADEECDDGNRDDGDGCDAYCQNEPYCGDGHVDAGEECDDGNNVGGDGCDGWCEVEPYCGDGYVDEGEECDDGNQDYYDGCDDECMREPGLCGDGYLDEGEECDDGNDVNDDGCTNHCYIQPPNCGDGYLDPDEECDDGNTKNGDGCTCFCDIEPYDGCTPGYWKQDQHFDSWPAEVSPDTLFVDVFGVDAFPGMTLLEVLSQGGGGLIALGRHAVAGYLNALSDGVEYPYGTGTVINWFSDAYNSGVYNKKKNKLANANELGCPLN